MLRFSCDFTNSRFFPDQGPTIFKFGDACHRVVAPMPEVYILVQMGGKVLFARRSETIFELIFKFLTYCEEAFEA